MAESLIEGIPVCRAGTFLAGRLGKRDEVERVPAVSVGTDNRLKLIARTSSPASQYKESFP
jgi:hypothetical protein